LWLGVNAFAAYDLDRPIAFDHLISDGINADGGYTLASRVSADFPESDLLQFLVLLSISASCSYGFSVFTSSPLNS
jgi:hypothetical protein